MKGGKMEKNEYIKQWAEKLSLSIEREVLNE